MRATTFAVDTKGGKVDYELEALGVTGRSWIPRGALQMYLTRQRTEGPSAVLLSWCSRTRAGAKKELSLHNRAVPAAEYPFA